MTRMRIAALGATLLLWTGAPVRPAGAQAAPPPAPAPAAGQETGWPAVSAATRENLEVLTIDGNWHKGRLRLATDEGITLDAGQPAIARDQVWQVWTAGKPSWTKRGFWAGLAVGVALPVLVFATQGDCTDPMSACARDGYFSGGNAAAGAIVLGPAFGALGALMGRWIGGPGRDPRLVYSGPTRRNPTPPAPGDRR